MQEIRLLSLIMRIDGAVKIIDSWLSIPSTKIIVPTDQHCSIVQKLLSQLGTAGNLISDAYPAALATEHSARLYFTDNGFARFKGVRWINSVE